MEIGAVAEILEYVFGFGERRVAAPGRTFAAHLRECVGAPVHPGDHVMATDAAQRARTFRNGGRGVVRTTGAIVRGTRKNGAWQAEFLFLGGNPPQPVIDRIAGEEARQTLGNHARNARWRQFIRRRQNPFVGFVELADDARTRGAALYGIRPVVHRFLHLRFDEGTLLLDHDDVFESARKLADTDRLERPGHADFVHTYTDVRGRFRVDAQVFQCLKHIEIALARGDDTQPRLRRIDHQPIDAVRARERDRCLDRVLVQAHFLIQRRVRPADVQAPRRQREIFRQDDVELVWIDVDAGRGFHGLGNGLEADPAAGETRHRPAEQAHVENILHAS